MSTLKSIILTILILTSSLSILMWIQGKEQGVTKEYLRRPWNGVITVVDSEIYNDSDGQLLDGTILVPRKEVESMKPYCVKDILDAIQTVEVGGTGEHTGTYMFGDNQKALGPFQIHWAYHEDAITQDDMLYDHETCLRSYQYSVRTVLAYMKRYAPEHVQVDMSRDQLTIEDCEIIARLHNGGPKGPLKESTLDYWKRVKALL